MSVTVTTHQHLRTVTIDGDVTAFFGLPDPRGNEPMHFYLAFSDGTLLKGDLARNFRVEVDGAGRLIVDDGKATLEWNIEWAMMDGEYRPRAGRLGDSLEREDVCSAPRNLSRSSLRRHDPYEHDEIRRRMTIQLQLMKPADKRRIGIDDRGAVEKAVDLIMSRVLAGTVIVTPSMVPGQHYPGKFGVDEPHPFPDLIKQ